MRCDRNWPATQLLIDGRPSHNGMWELSMLGVVAGMRVAAPRDATRLHEELGEALDVRDRHSLPER